MTGEGEGEEGLGDADLGSGGFDEGEGLVGGLVGEEGGGEEQQDEERAHGGRIEAGA